MSQEKLRRLGKKVHEKTTFSIFVAKCLGHRDEGLGCLVRLPMSYGDRHGEKSGRGWAIASAESDFELEEDKFTDFLEARGSEIFLDYGIAVPYNYSYSRGTRMIVAAY